MTVWLGRMRGALRSRLWPMPTMVVVLAVAAGLALPRLDAHIDAKLPRWLADLMFGGDAGAARTVLDAVAGSLITVTSLTFSLTVVTLQLASSQFSPRLLRTFTRDLFVQATLALFLGTFAYSLAVLRSVRSPGNLSDTGPGGSGFVPQIAVTVAFVLALVSVIALVLFLAHLARQIRVETMLQTVYDDAVVTLRQTLPGNADTDETTGSPMRESVSAVLLAQPDGAVVIWSGRPGFLIRLDEAELLAAAVSVDAVVAMDRDPGSFLVGGTPIGTWWSRDHSDLGPEQAAELARQIRAAMHTGAERTEHQDVGYGLRQLTDVAVKALSPGINDPTTAVHALNHTTALLCELADHDPGPRILRDDTEHVRVILHRPDLGDLLEVALTQPRRYGAADPAVLGRLFQLVAEVARHARADQQFALADQLTRLVHTAGAQDFDFAETARLRNLADLARQAIAVPRIAGRADTANERTRPGPAAGRAHRG